MSFSINGTNGVTYPDASTQATAGFTGFRNRIINGGMVIDQRNAGASFTPNQWAYGGPDRWQYYMPQASKFTVQQNAGSVTPPAGFTNYLGFTSSSAYSVISTDFFGVSQKIEGYNVQDLAWGTPNAQSVTLSFWVRSSLTGTFGGSLINSAENRSYPFSYTISSANTWTYITITIPGDTTGTWLTNNSCGVRLNISLGCGSSTSATAGSWASGFYASATGATSVVGTNGATFYITGVQLEKGSTATPFEFRQYGTELALCQRYYQLVIGANGGVNANFEAGLTHINFSTQMRSAPTITEKTVLANSNTGSVAFDDPQTFGTGFYVGITAPYWYRRSISTASAEL